MSQGKIQRPHHRWTSVGKQRVTGREVNDALEITGLKLTSPCVVVQVGRPEAQLSHHLFMLAEALDVSDIEQPLTLANEGNAEHGLIFCSGMEAVARLGESGQSAAECC